MNWTEQQVADYYAARGRKVTAVAKPHKPRGYHVHGTMNKTETAYSEYLTLQQLAGSIQTFWFEAMTLRMQPTAKLTPDFMVLDKEGVAFHEIKGTRRGKLHAEDDAIVKLKWAAQAFPCFRFFLCHKLPNGEWEQKEIR